MATISNKVLSICLLTMMMHFKIYRKKALMKRAFGCAHLFENEFVPLRYDYAYWLALASANYVVAAIA